MQATHNHSRPRTDAACLGDACPNGPPSADGGDSRRPNGRPFAQPKADSGDQTISVCIIAFNEEFNIRRCLESVKWADEIVVVDSFSQDRTVEIAREYTSKVYQHQWQGYIGQKKLIKDLATCSWVMFVDADEEVSGDLREEIRRCFEAGIPESVAGFEFPRRVRYLGRWIRHGDWYPDIKLRLFRKTRSECGGTEPHDRIFVTGAVRRLRGPLYHYTYAGITEQVASINRFSSISAECRYDEGEKFLLCDLTLRPLFRFLRCYVLKAGWRDGLPGLIIAVNVAFGTFVKYAKLWEKDHARRFLRNEQKRSPESTPASQSGRHGHSADGSRPDASS